MQFPGAAVVGTAVVILLGPAILLGLTDDSALWANAAPGEADDARGACDSAVVGWAATRGETAREPSPAARL